MSSFKVSCHEYYLKWNRAKLLSTRLYIHLLEDGHFKGQQRVALFCSPLSRQTGDWLFSGFPNALRRSRRCCVRVLLVRVNDSTKAWCVFALRLREFTQVKTGILRETTGGLRSAQCLLVLYRLVLYCHVMLTSFKFHPNQLTPKFNINLATFCFSASMITNTLPHAVSFPSVSSLAFQQIRDT